LIGLAYGGLVNGPTIVSVGSPHLYGAEQAKKVEIKLEDVDRIIREHREKRKITHMI
jgi:hypothetical protein